MRFRRVVVTGLKQREPDGTVVARMLVVVSQPVHVFVSSLAWRDLAAERPQFPFRLALGKPFDARELRGRVEVALSVCQVVLQAVRLLVALHTPRLGALERLVEQERRTGA